MERAMQGKVCLVTGGTAGIGHVTARALAAQGSAVAVVGRNREKCIAAVAEIKRQTGNPQVDWLLADLSSQQAIRRLAADFLDRFPRLDVLVNNAGAMFLERRESVDGIEMTYALNHLGYYLLTRLLLERLRTTAPARIINVSSAAHERVSLEFGDLESRRGYRGFRAYARSKLANLLFTYELARRLEGSRVSVNALHPGVVATNFGAENGWRGRGVRLMFKVVGVSPEKGAQTAIYLASSPEVEGVTGKYFVKQRPVTSSPVSLDPEAAQELWRISAAMTGLPPD